jgi:membrane protease YdiL (CAAX protease family)
VAPFIGWASGAVAIAPTGALALGWMGQAVLAASIKSAFAVFEEIIFRGAVLSALRMWVPAGAAILLSAVVFAVGHLPRPLLDMAILVVDGVGFGVAAVVTGGLWVPIAWHASKNLAVWLLLDAGTVAPTRGLFSASVLRSSWLMGTTDGTASGLDLIVTVATVAVAVAALRYLTHERPDVTGR